MIIEVLDANLLKLDIIRKFTYCSYTKQVRGIGKFTIDAVLDDENKYLLGGEQYYVLFDSYVFGKVKKISKDEENTNIRLEGNLGNCILSQRVIDGITKMAGKTYELVKAYIEKVLVNTTDAKRKIAVDFEVDPGLSTMCSSVSKQVTGGYAWDAIEPLLTQDKICIDIVPQIDIEHNNVVDDVTYRTNISKFTVRIYAGIDRRMENSQGNEAILFSQSLSNIDRTGYTNDKTNKKTVAYVAGAGEGTERKWRARYADESVSTLNGWNRDELWVDARDIQGEQEDGSTLSEDEYNALLDERGGEKLNENVEETSYEATVTERNQYTYGTDYKLGDWVTIIDDDIGANMDAQICEVTKSVEGNREIVDISFQYGSRKTDLVKSVVSMAKKQEDVEADVQYLLAQSVRARNTQEEFSGDLAEVIKQLANVKKTADAALPKAGIEINGNTTLANLRSAGASVGRVVFNRSDTLPKGQGGIILNIWEKGLSILWSDSYANVWTWYVPYNKSGIDVTKPLAQIVVAQQIAGESLGNKWLITWDKVLITKTKQTITLSESWSNYKRIGFLLASSDYIWSSYCEVPRLMLNSIAGNDMLLRLYHSTSYQLAVELRVNTDKKSFTAVVTSSGEKWTTAHLAIMGLNE